MTTLYRLVLIESAEQAEALPMGTSVKRAVWHQTGHQDYYAGVKVGSNAWFTTSPTADLQDALSRHMVGWTALVPIEAEEVRVIASGGLERDYHGATVLNHTPDGPRRDYRRTEFHTPWEEA